jgi:hypothetical protein
MDTLARLSRSRAVALGAAAILMTISTPGQTATTCAAESGAQTVPLVELFTSEGCDSCPPADRWLASQFPVTGSAGPVTVLAFHVDYWDRLGWKDRFAKAEYTRRQHDAMRANGATFVYTPQVLVQGHDVPSWRGGKVGEVLAAARQRPARANVAVAADADAGGALTVRAQVKIPDPALRKNAVLWVVYADSGLVSDVKAGENRGVQLHHDYVVRSLAGPFAVDAKGDVAASLAGAMPLEKSHAAEGRAGQRRYDGQQQHRHPHEFGLLVALYMQYLLGAKPVQEKRVDECHDADDRHHRQQQRRASQQNGHGAERGDFEGDPVIARAAVEGRQQYEDSREREYREDRPEQSGRRRGKNFGPRNAVAVALVPCGIEDLHADDGCDGRQQG